MDFYFDECNSQPLKVSGDAKQKKRNQASPPPPKKKANSPSDQHSPAFSDLFIVSFLRCKIFCSSLFLQFVWEGISQTRWGSVEQVQVVLSWVTISSGHNWVPVSSESGHSQVRVGSESDQSWVAVGSQSGHSWFTVGSDN